MSAELHSEILKLLLQVAFADHKIEESEVSYIMEYAARNEISEFETSVIKQFLTDKGTSLPPPNFALLREHKEKVMGEVRRLVRADRNICENEREVFDEIEDLLQV